MASQRQPPVPWPGPDCQRAGVSGGPSPALSDAEQGRPMPAAGAMSTNTRPRQVGQAGSAARACLGRRTQAGPLGLTPGGEGMPGQGNSALPSGRPAAQTPPPRSHSWGSHSKSQPQPRPGPRAESPAAQETPAWTGSTPVLTRGSSTWGHSPPSPPRQTAAQRPYLEVVQGHDVFMFQFLGQKPKFLISVGRGARPRPHTLPKH